jgi:hypothetical protein
MDPLLAEIIRRVESVIRRFEEHCLRERVRGFRPFTREERRSFANELGWRIDRDRCDCGLDVCERQHRAAAQPGSGLGLPLFVEQAVAGPLGVRDCRANSLRQGMFYQWILKGELGMLVALVEFKRCADPGCRNAYEEDTCPPQHSGCGRPYSPQDTEVFAEERLILPGVYVSVRRWGCGSSHYYRQQRCWEELVPPLTDFHPHVHHDPGGKHDHCPWCGCPNGNPRHADRGRGTTLWVRRELAGSAGQHQPAADPTTPRRLEAYEEATRQWLDTLDDAIREVLRQAIAADPDVDSQSRDDPLVIMGWVLSGRQTVVPEHEVQRFRDLIRRELEDRGLVDDRPGN